MLSKDYSHYNKLTKQDLISMIEKRDIEIKKNQEKLKEVNKLKNEYYNYNKFHMEEITRLDKEIGKYKGLRK
tara:strand:- start:3265 stop:3480 length:216 start_codon:yes stop_codon:yes gene_type:complete